MIAKPKISVIMAVYNAESYLEEAIDSILEQSFTDFEFLILNDCSTDNSSKILDEYASKDERVKIFTNKENLGLTKNLNKLIKLANGEFLARMDADDISLSKRFEEQINFFENHPDIHIVGTFSQDISENGEVIGERTVPVSHEEIVKLLPTLNPLSHPTVMMRSSVIDKVEGYDERFRTSQDYHLWFKAVGKGLKIDNIPKILFQYRMNDDFVARKGFKFRWNMFKAILSGYKLINHPWYKYHYALLTLALAFIPPFLFAQVKKLDPR
ncbi:hypothetical protein GCM10023311_01140 [Flaviramulus aquimarinus]|uniref:Glycosyltransferase 2-like domain-containing protein n=1 Tax=Flaviramulus aquimarinus TaxID=1170456 RepID=A0ABP9EM68_9FLAO